MLKRINKGFTLIELLVVISIVGFLTVASVVVFNIVRMNARDTVRVGNMATVRRALAMYLNDSTAGYYPSNGECISAAGGVGAELKAKQVLLAVPLDPLWSVAPGSISNGVAVSPSQNFCYYYFSGDREHYSVSYYLESNSKAGNAGINVATQ